MLADIDDDTNGFVTSDDTYVSLFTSCEDSEVGSTNAGEHNGYFNMPSNKFIYRFVIYQAKALRVNQADCFHTLLIASIFWQYNSPSKTQDGSECMASKL